MVKKIIALITFFFLLNISFSIADNPPIPLPPSISLKQKQSIDKVINSTKAEEEQKKQEIYQKQEKVVENTKTINIVKAPHVSNNMKITIGVNKNDGDMYLPLASTICIFINESESNSCNIKQYDSSIKSVEGLINGDVDFLITNAVLAKYVFDGKEPFNNNMQNKKLRFVSSIFNEVLAIVARSDARIKKLDDIKNTSINLSKSYTKTRLFMDSLFSLKNWTMNDFKKVSELEMQDEISAICSGDIQVMTVVAQKFNQYLKDVTRSCEVNIVGLSKEEINQFTIEPQFVYEKIDGGTYIGMPIDIETIATKVLLLSTSDVSNDKVFFVIEKVIKHLKDMKNLHISFSQIKAHDFLSQGRVLPLHEGANEFINKNGTVGVN
jgi:TRAP transporter TAXI family solute receptor